MKQLYLSILCLLFTTVLSAQTPDGAWCGSNVTAEDIAYIESQRDSKKSSTRGKISDGVIGVPLTIHIINQSDGTGGIPIADVQGAIEIMNGYFANANMFFFIDGEVNYINDDDFYDFDRAREGVIANPNDVKNTVNVYFANTVNSAGTPLCGYATFPGGADRVVMANGCTPNGLTLTHELGHYFRLFHPHEIAFGRELVDGSNCTSAGDLLCSTPADPNLTGKVSFANNRCTYTGTSRDANGDFYVPDITNIMSYSLDACQNSMTQEQYERMRETLEEERSYLKLRYESFAIKFDANVTQGCFPLRVEFKDTSIGAFQRSWTFEGGFPTSSNLPDPVVTFENPGVYTVSLTVTSAGGEELNSVKEDYIIVIDPSVGITREDIDKSFEDGELLTGDWEEVNNDPNVSLRVDAISATGNFSVVVPNYNNPVNNETEILVSPSLDYADLNYVDLIFDRAYAYFATEINKSDTLELVYKQRCDANEWQVIARYTGDELTTAVLNSQEEFIPAAGDWSPTTLRYTVRNLDPILANIQFGFRTINANGNNLYIDNIILNPNYDLAVPEITNVTLNSSGDHIIRFTDNSNNEKSFTLERSVNGSEFRPVGDALRNATVIADQNITESGEYRYRIRANGEYSNSEFSNEFLFNSSITSVEEELPGTELNIYPNPAENRLFIQASGIPLKQIQLITVSGRIIRQMEINQNDIELDLSDLADGLYILQLRTADDVVARRIAVSR